MIGVFLVFFPVYLFATTHVIEWPFFERQSKYSVRIEYQLESQNGFIRFNDLVDYKYGDLVKIKGTKRLCREPRNPGMFNECHW